MRVEIGLSRSEGLGAWLIASATTPGRIGSRHTADTPTHAFIRFENGDHAWIFEAREFSGPEGWRRVEWHAVATWLYADSRRWARLYDITDILAVDPEELHRRCIARLDVWRYSHHQIARMWAYRRLGWRVPDDPSRVVCSEAVVRILNGVPRQGEHPALPRGWIGEPPDNQAPYDLEAGLGRLQVPFRKLRRPYPS